MNQINTKNELKSGVWYTQGSMLYILKETGKVKNTNNGFVIEIVNDLVIKVESQNNHFEKDLTQSDIEIRQAKLAEHIKKLLDENPFVE